MKTITKKNVLKLAATALIFCFAIGAANSQILEDYQDVNETVYQTTGLGLRLYVEPDMVYHPDYNASDNSGLNTSSQWRWVYGFSWELLNDGDLDASIQVKDWTAEENWVELSGAALPDVGATRTYWVKERFAAAGCESAIATSKTVAVVGEPSITAFAGQGTGTWVEVNAGVHYTFCGEGLTDVLDITLQEEGSLAGLQEYTYGISVIRTAFDGNMAEIVGQEAVDVTATHGQEADLDGMLTGLAHTFNVPAMNMHEVGTTKYATRFVFNLTPASLTSKTSRVSHYRAAAANSPYEVPGTTVTYWLYPTPTTGPIFHIPNEHF